MNKSLILGLVVGAAVVTAGAAIATRTSLFDRDPHFAEVIKVDPVSETIRTPREVCEDQVVTHTQPVKDEHRIAGRDPAAAVVINGPAVAALGASVRSTSCRSARPDRSRWWTAVRSRAS